MYKWFREWIRQKALEKLIEKQHMCDMFLYDYKDGQYELLIEGPANDHIEAQVHTFVDEMLNGTSGRKHLIAIYRTYEGGGLMMAMRPNKKHFEKYFLKNVYSTDVAFIAIADWCKKAG